MSKHGTCSCGCENESKQCHCDETCTCGCQEGKPCTCGYECDCGCCGNQNKEIAFELCRTLIEGRTYTAEGVAEAFRKISGCRPGSGCRKTARIRVGRRPRRTRVQRSAS